ncbi:MAG: hypothetical protein HY648_03695 [Acidobacteria bacterium]|nr:hypothetical protein [Acidobacteriota bacterium]
MHRRQRIILQGVLAVAAVWMGWRLAAEWGQANLRYAALAQAKGETAGPLAANLPNNSLPSAQEIVAQNLFSPDRNNDLAQEEKATPRPPVPTVFGTMKLGADYEALLAEGGPRAGSGFQRVKQGEKFAGYTVVEIRDEKVELEYGGEKTTVDVYQSANSVPRAAAPAAPAAPTVEKTSSLPPPTPAPAASQAAPTPAANAGVPISEPSADPNVKITIEGNRRRYEIQTPFGTMIRYEDIR